MRLKRFEVRNFKAIQNVGFDLEDLLVLIGENNCGKSCMLAALDWFLGGSAIKDTALFHRYETGPDGAIELTGHFDQLTDEDKAEVAVKGRMNGDEWVLRKKFWFEKGKAGDAEKGGWKEQLYSYSSGEQLAHWPDPATSWKSFPADYEPLIQQIPDHPAKPNNESREALKQLVSRPGDFVSSVANADGS